MIAEVYPGTVSVPFLASLVIHFQKSSAFDQSCQDLRQGMLVSFAFWDLVWRALEGLK